MDGVFTGADVVAVVLPPGDEADDLAALFVHEFGEFEVELGAPIVVSRTPVADTPSLQLIVDPTVGAPRLELDAGACRIRTTSSTSRATRSADTVPSGS